MHGVAVASLLVTPLDWAWRLPALVIVAVSAATVLRPSRVASLNLHQDGRLECVLTEGGRAQASALSGSTVFPWLVVLRLRVDGARGVTSLALFPDHMAREEFRVLRLWLRWALISDSGAGSVS